MSDLQNHPGAAGSTRWFSPVEWARGISARLAEQHRSYGLWRTLHAATFRRLERLGFHLFLVELGDDRPDIERPQLPEGYTTRPVDLEELRNWVGVIEGITEPFLKGAMARGDRCVGNFHQDELVGHGFVTRERAPVTDQLEVVVDDWLLYRYKGWTHPDHRRRHLSHARGRMNRHLFPMREGMRTVDYVAVHNLPSKLKHADLHPVRLGYCGYVRILGAEYPFTGRVPRRFGFRLQRRESTP